MKTSKTKTIDFKKSISVFNVDYYVYYSCCFVFDCCCCCYYWWCFDEEILSQVHFGQKRTNEIAICSFCDMHNFMPPKHIHSYTHTNTRNKRFAHNILYMYIPIVFHCHYILHIRFDVATLFRFRPFRFSLLSALPFFNIPSYFSVQNMYMGMLSLVRHPIHSIHLFGYNLHSHFYDKSSLSLSLCTQTL